MIRLGYDSSADLSLEKAKLRKQYLMQRKSIGTAEKSRLDKGIFQILLSSQIFMECELLLTYVSVNNEADTRGIIQYAIESGKIVAVPRCIPGKNEMEFFTIDSAEDLKKGSYGLPEPELENKRKLSKASGGLCLLPGLSFDPFGNRLGYGGGYYDRYLNGFKGISAGLCYTQLISSEQIPCEKNDKKVQYIITENKIMKID